MFSDKRSLSENNKGISNSEIKIVISWNVSQSN